MRKIESREALHALHALHRKPAGYGVRCRLCLFLAVSLLSGGCRAGQVPTVEGDDSKAVLLDPIEELETFEAAAYRNLYDARVYTGSISLDIVEYSFPAGSVVFDHFAVTIGDKVRKGQELAYADTEALDERIEEMEEQIKKAEEEYRTYLEVTEEELYEPEQEADRLKSIVENLEKAEPEKYALVYGEVSGGDAVIENESPISEEYEKWEEEYNKYNGQYRILAHQNNTIRLQMEQRTQLYELDRAYMLEQLELLKEEKKQYIVTSSINGEVVAIKQGEPISVDEEDPYATTAPRCFLKASSPVQKNEEVIAVGDTSHKLVKCDYIRTPMIESAQEIYAFIDGKRYDVQYINGETEKYSAFGLPDEDGLTVGRPAYIVVVNQSREHVLTVPASAVSGEPGGYYVYSRQGNGSVMTPVTTGMSDGVYVEILTGLSEGDEVVTAATMKAGQGRSVLEVGSPSNEVDYKGVLFYPETCLVKNPVRYGTAYFSECMVEPYQQVKAGDVIAAIYVQKDDILLLEYEKRLGRLKERLADLVSLGEEKNKNAITEQRKMIAEIEEEMAEWNRDQEITKIVAPTAGVILSTPYYSEGDILDYGETVAEIAVVEDEKFYLAIPKAGPVVGYGDEDLVVNYLGSDDERHQANVKSVSLPTTYLGDSLASDCALVLLPATVADEMLGLYASVSGTGYREEVTVKVPIRPIKDVVLVPSAAVKLISGKPYVFVVEENGEIVARSFIAAGNGYGYYWVIDGLSEGMEVCI